MVKVNSSFMKILDPEQERILKGEIRQEEHHKESKDSKVKSPIEYENDQVWTLSFDGSKSKKISGAGVELISPTRETYLEAHRL